MRENIQMSAAFAANAIIFANDLVKSVTETFAFMMGVLL